MAISAHADVQGGAEDVLPALEQPTINKAQGMVLPAAALLTSAAPPWLKMESPLPLLVQAGLGFYT